MDHSTNELPKMFYWSIPQMTLYDDNTRPMMVRRDRDGVPTELSLDPKSLVNPHPNGYDIARVIAYKLKKPIRSGVAWMKEAVNDLGKVYAPKN